MADEQKVPDGWVDAPWDGDASRWEDAASYCDACLIDLNPRGKDKIKALCMLPYKEPNGKINVRGVMAAAGGRGISRITRPEGVSADAFAAAKKAAAKKLISLYRQMGRTAPEICYRLAGEKMPVQ